MRKDSLGDRMKNNYENRNRIYLNRRTPVIIRLDGRAFHTLTKHLEKPYDKDFIEVMQKTAEFLVNEVQGCSFAYVQSDEISLLLTDFDKFDTQAWFDYNVQKIISISASLATAKFNELWCKNEKLYKITKNSNPCAVFDARCFNIPEDEVKNYFIWRQQDWVRNSILMLAQAHFSNKFMHGKKCFELDALLEKEKNVKWDQFDSHLKYGTHIIGLKELSEWLDLDLNTTHYSQLLTENTLIERLLNLSRFEK